MTEREQLIAGLRKAVDALYGCRYSEQPLARELDDLLKDITGKSQADLAYDWMAERAREAAERKTLSRRI